MKRREFITLLSAVGGAAAWPLAARAQPARDRILYCTHSAGYRHESVPLSHAILQQLGETSGWFAVDATEDVAALTAESLQRCSAVMFFTSGELPMSAEQKSALLAFVRAGYGFLGVHSATDTCYEWTDYGRLIGGYFNGHPWHQAVRITVADPLDPIVSFAGPTWHITDEIYQIRNFDAAGSRVLLRLDPTSVDLAKPGVDRQPYGWPLAWVRPFGSGRVFYCALGHEPAVWRDARYQQMLINAIAWSVRRPVRT